MTPIPPTSHDDTATTWRDLADQLTPEQIAELEYCERGGVPPGLADAEHQLNGARAMARHNLIQTLCADIPAPPDAAGRLYAWEEWGDGHGRVYTVSTRTGANTSVEILGIQHDDGRVERFILAQASDDDGGMTAAQARQFAAVLLDAADELDGLGL
jgi:hypothetical protein